MKQKLNVLGNDYVIEDGKGGIFWRFLCHDSPSIMFQGLLCTFYHTVNKFGLGIQSSNGLKRHLYLRNYKMEMLWKINGSELVQWSNDEQKEVDKNITFVKGNCILNKLSLLVLFFEGSETMILISHNFIVLFICRF